MSDWLIEGVGYLGSLLVVISLTLGNVRNLRIINMLGAIAYTVYGIYFAIYPVIIANVVIVGANLFHLWRLTMNRELFHLIPVTGTTSTFLPLFLEYHLEGILQRFPHFELDSYRDLRHVLVTRNLIPVGVFSYTLEADGHVRIHLDYVIPSYRDYQTARYLFNEFGNLLTAKGYHSYVTESAHKEHQKYLKKMGFAQDPHNPETWTKEV